MARKKGTDIELDESLRLITLKHILEARSVEYMAKEFGITDKGVKFRLTNLYKYYGVKNKYELMAKFVKMPDEVFNLSLEHSASDDYESSEDSFEDMQDERSYGAYDTETNTFWK